MSSIRSLGGRTPQQLGLVVLRGSQRPILPNTRDRTLIIPGRNGALDFGADMELRLFSLECAFNAQNNADLQQRVEVLARLLVDSFGKPRTLDLVFDVHPDRTYKVRYSGSATIDRVAGLGLFTLPLVAFEPYALGLEQLTETTVTTSPYETVIQSSGDIRTEPLIVLTNNGGTTITSFTLTNEYRID